MASRIRSPEASHFDHRYSRPGVERVVKVASQVGNTSPYHTNKGLFVSITGNSPQQRKASEEATGRARKSTKASVSGESDDERRRASAGKPRLPTGRDERLPDNSDVARGPRQTSNRGTASEGQKKDGRSKVVAGAHVEDKSSGKPLTPAQDLLHRLVQTVELRRDIRWREEQDRLHSPQVTAASDEKIESERLSHLLVFLKDGLQQQTWLLANLATRPGMSRDPSLGPLSSQWFTSVKLFHDAHTAVEKLVQVSEELKVRMATASDAVNGKLQRRTLVLLNASRDDSWPGDARRIDEEISAVRHEQKDVETQYCTACIQLANGRSMEAAYCDRALEQADEILVGAGLLEVPKEPLVEAQGESPQLDRPRSRASKGLAASHDSRRDDQRKQEEYPERRNRRRQPDLGEQLRSRKLDELKLADHAWTKAEQDFDAVRRHYSQDLAGFLSACERGDMHGTRTEFDAQYFLNRARANRKLAKAASEYEHARKAAQMVGALPWEQTSNFADRSDDGYLDGDFLGPANLDRAAIEKWRTDEGQQEVDGEAQWLQDLPSPGSTASTVAVESSCSQYRYAEHKWRKVIDQWRGEQEATRSAMKQIPESRSLERAGSAQGWRAGRSAAFCGVALPKPASQRRSPQVLEARLPGGTVRFSLGNA